MGPYAASVKRIFLAIAMWAAGARAQIPAPAAGPWTDDNAERIERLVREWQLEHQAPWRQELAARRAEEARRREFTERANRFVAAWNRFVRSYTRSGVFNVKEARELTKAFRELEATGMPK